MGARIAVPAVLLAVLGGCAAGQSTAREQPLELARVRIRPLTTDAPEGSDARPRFAVVVRAQRGAEITREASAAVRFADGAAYVDARHRLVVIDAGGDERVLGHDVLAAPVVDAHETRIAWAEAHELGAPLLRTFGAGHASPVTIARAPGVMAPIALLEGDTLALVGSVNGGVAGLWLAEARGGGALTCLTNCALRTGRPWGDAYVPPPAAGATIHVDRDRVTFVAADGTQRMVRR